MFFCEVCQKSFRHKCSLKRHVKNCGIFQQTFSCDSCSKEFKRKDNLERHLKTCDKDEHRNLTCLTCQTKFSKYSIYRKHISMCRSSSTCISNVNCRACDTSLPTTQKIATHTLTCEDDSQQHVDRSFSSNKTLATHSKVKHSKFPPASQQNSHPEFNCEFCQKSFRRKYSLNRHIKNCGIFKTSFACIICAKRFTRDNNLQRHILEMHTNDVSNLTSRTCPTVLPDHLSYRGHVAIQRQKAFPSNKTLETHTKAKHSKRPSTTPSNKTLETHTKAKHSKHPSTIQQSGGGEPAKRVKTSAGGNGNECSRQAINGNVREWEYIPKNKKEGLDPLFYMVKIKHDVLEVLKTELDDKKSIKFGLCAQFEFSKKSKDDRETLVAPYFRTKMIPVTRSSDVGQSYQEAMRKIMKDMDNYQGESSSLKFERVLRIQLSVVKYQPFRGTSYLDLPDGLIKKRSILNIRNMDDELCFVYSVLAHLFPVSVDRVKETVAEYTLHMDQLDLDGFDFPMSLKDIKRFEQVNNLSINVYGYEEKTLFPLHVSDDVDIPKERCLDLLLITSEVEEEGEPHISHYCLITSLSAVVCKDSDRENFKHICRKCLWPFRTVQCLEKHKHYCHYNAQTIRMPDPDKAVRHFGLRQMSKTQRVSYVIYADFETVLAPLEKGERATQKIQHHVPCGYSYKVVCRVDHLSKPLKVYSGQNAANDFMINILADYDECMEHLKYENRAELVITADDEKNIQSATDCYLCHKPLGEKAHRDHDHLTGQYRGMCHPKCNLNFQEADFVACICHNGTRYDNHLILQAAEHFHDRKLTCIPLNTEQFIMFQIDRLRFLDSFKFLSTSLDNLVKNLQKRGQDQFEHLASHFPEHIDMLTRKLPYFYEYVDSFEKLDETKFPTRDQFYSSLTESTVSEADYDFAHQLWDTFDCQTIRDFMEIYVSTDTLILADVMERFRTMCLEFYGLDPFHYYTLPGLAMDACLKMTQIELELMVDPDQYAFVEKGIRGGVAMIGHRHAEANNKYMSQYDKNKPESYLMYFDVNSLYATCMMKPLPHGDFQWVDPVKVQNIDWLSQDPEGEQGYILEVDLVYPRELHQSHSTLPVAPTKESIPYAELSPYHKNLLKELGMKGEKPTGTKLFSTLNDKNNYIIHYETLKFYLHLGLKLIKIHRVLQFRQSKWMKPYIEFNTKQRKEATDDFSKDLFKLLSNAVYGKQLQNVRKYQHVVLVTSEEKVRWYSAKTNFKSVKIFSKNLVAISLEKVSVTLNQPVSVGFTILEHAKRILFYFHYDVMMKEYGDQLKLVMTDTDSLLYHISASSVDTCLRNPYNFMLSNLSLFDTSNYPNTHRLYSKVNHKELGVMKDEAGGKIITEFVGLRAKNYSFLTQESTGVTNESKRAKGIQVNCVKKHLHHQMFKDCLFDKKKVITNYNQILSDHNELYTVRVNKIALMPHDDKRYLLEDGITSRPYGYNPIP